MPVATALSQNVEVNPQRGGNRPLDFGVKTFVGDKKEGDNDHLAWNLKRSGSDEWIRTTDLGIMRPSL